MEKRIDRNTGGTRLRILVVDDDSIRRTVLVNMFVNECNIPRECIDTAGGTSKAKKAMRTQYYDLLILDVILPKIDVAATAQNGLDLLSEISRRSTLIRPGSIIGITASKKDISSFSVEFNSYCFNVFEATRNSNSWKERLANSVEYIKLSKIGKSTQEKKTLCISVHGIQTYATWQHQLERSIVSNIKDVEVIDFKYGYFSLFSFIIPFLRLAVIRKFTSDFQRVLNNRENQRVIVFAHSFGSYVAVKSIEKILKMKGNVSVDTLVLCGSVLKSSYNFSRIQNKTNMRIVNECGINDNILLLSQIFVPNTGMAGRVGFIGFNSDKFVNRYYKGGHSLYFDGESKFIEKFWLSLFDDSQKITRVDQRENKPVKVYIVDKLLSFIGKFKELVYILIIIWGLLNCDFVANFIILM